MSLTGSSGIANIGTLFTSDVEIRDDMVEVFRDVVSDTVGAPDCLTSCAAEANMIVAGAGSVEFCARELLVVISLFAISHAVTLDD